MINMVLTKEVYMVANAPMITMEVLTESPRAFITHKIEKKEILHLFVNIM